MNKFIIKGRLTRDPEIKQTQSGVHVCNFTVAVDRKFSRQGDEKQTDFVDCVAWRGLCDMVGKHFHKGKEIIVIGENQSEGWTDSNGNKRTSWKLQADEVYFCGSNESRYNNHDTEDDSSKLNEPVFTEMTDDDPLPF